MPPVVKSSKRSALVSLRPAEAPTFTSDQHADDDIGFDDDGFAAGPWDNAGGIAGYGEAAAAELELTLPVFVQLQNGLLYVYNRDPSGATRAVAPVSLQNTNFSPKVLQAQYDQWCAQPLRLLARLMLTDNAVSSTAVTLPAAFDSATGTNSISQTAFLLHFHAPTSKTNAAGVPIDASTNALVGCYTYFSKALLSMNFSIVCSNYSVLQTWKLRLREHITFTERVCERVTSYVSSTVVNRHFLGDMPQAAQKVVHFDQVDDEGQQRDTEALLRVQKGQLELFDRNFKNRVANAMDDVPYKIISLANKRMQSYIVRTVRVGVQRAGKVGWQDDTALLDRHGLGASRQLTGAARVGMQSGSLSPRVSRSPSLSHDGLAAKQPQTRSESSDAGADALDGGQLALSLSMLDNPQRLYEASTCIDRMVLQLANNNPDAQDDSFSKLLHHCHLDIVAA